MELKIDIPFDVVNEIVFEALDSKGIDIVNRNIIRLIGFWYYRFALTSPTQFFLTVPVFQKEIIKPLLEYLFYLDLLIKLFVDSSKQELSDSGLFNILSYRTADKYNRRHRDYKLRYLSSTKAALSFEQNVVISNSRFLPIFPIDQINSYKEEIFDAFYLYRGVARENLIGHAILIEPNKKTLLLVTESQDFDTAKLQFKYLKTSEFKDDDKRDEILDSFENIDVASNINFKYPYHVNVGSTVIKEFGNRSKQFNLELQQRFCYTEIAENEVLLTPVELDVVQSSAIFDFLRSYVIIETPHPDEFNARFKEFKHNWKQAQLNIFASPFPIKWFMLIHSGESLSYWQQLFAKDYPSVSGSLLLDAFSLIEIVYGINWVDTSLPSDSAGFLIMPKGLKFNEITSSFKKHISDRYIKVICVDDELKEIPSHSKVWIIDPFNIIFLSSQFIRLLEYEVKIIVPDFLNFSYNPFIRYRIAKYQYTALLGGARQWADLNYARYFEEWTEFSNELLMEIRNDLKKYNVRFATETAVAEHENDIDETMIDAPELLESEVIQFVAKKEERMSRNVCENKLLVRTKDGAEIILKPSTPILLYENGYIIKTIASLLEINSRFIPIHEVIKNLDVSLLADKMTSISQKAKNWRHELFVLKELEPNLYAILSSRGLSVKVGTFNNDYVSEQTIQGDFQLPRSKYDWRLVCDYIGVVDMQATWMAHKFRADINALKRAYIEIINFLVLNSSFGVNVNETVVKYVSNILSKLPDSEVDVMEAELITRSVIAEINNRVKLLQVEFIKEQNI